MDGEERNGGREEMETVNGLIRWIVIKLTVERDSRTDYFSRLELRYFVNIGARNVVNEDRAEPFNERNSRSQINVIWNKLRINGYLWTGGSLLRKKKRD